MLFRPGRLNGIGACQLIAPLAEEATANLQLRIDSMNLKTSPVLVGPAEWMQKYSEFGIYPGAILPEDTPNDLRALKWDSDVDLSADIGNELSGRAMALLGAEGYGELSQKVRKNGEIQNVLSAADSKFDLFLFCLQEPMCEVAERIVQYHLLFDTNLNETFVGSDKKTYEITREVLEGSYRYIATATSSTATPEARLAITQAKDGVVAQYIAGVKQAPEYGPWIWHAARQTLADMGERQPEAWLPPEPPMRQAIQMLTQAGVAAPPSPQFTQPLFSNAAAGTFPANAAAGALNQQ
jgi:hypothetical protein